MTYPITRQFGPNAKGSELTFADMDNNLLYLDAKVTGSNGYITLFNGTSAVSSSVIYQSTGLIGINTTSPLVNLDVKGTTLGGKIRIQNSITTDWAELQFSGSSTNQAIIFLNGSAQTGYAGANSFNIYQSSNAPLAFWTNATERIRIDSSGNVGIGKISPNALLDVNGNTIITGSLTTTGNAVIAGSATVSSITGSLLVPNLGGISLAGGVFTNPSTLAKTQLNLIDDTGATLNVSASSNSIFTSQGGDIVIRTGTFFSTPTERLRITTAGNTSVTGSLTATSLGYPVSSGTGGTITQITSKSTPVTLNKICGQITTNSASLAAATGVVFTVNNNTVAATDVIIVNISSVTNSSTYVTQVVNVAAGSFNILLRNITGVSQSEAVTLNFAVIKAANN